MYHINQDILDELSNIDVADLDEWGTRLLNILEEQEAASKEEEKDRISFSTA